jgi:outer membrane protein assembly factor BamB
MPFRPLLLALVVALGRPGLAAPPRQFRGDGTGLALTATPPLRWSPETNVVWSTPLPSWSNASPVVLGDRVCACSEPTTIFCADAATGRLLWQREVTLADTLPEPEGSAMRARVKEVERVAAALAPKSERLERLKRELRRSRAPAETKAEVEALTREINEARRQVEQLADYRAPPDVPVAGNSSSTPFTDGKNLFALFGNHVVVSLDPDGRVRWARSRPRLKGTIEGYVGGQAASPVMAGSLLIVPLGDLSALDPDTGETVWTQGEYRFFGTPAVVNRSGVDLLLLPGGAIVQARDGRIVAQAKSSVWFVGPTPWKDLFLYAGTGDDAGPHATGRVFAYRLPATLEGPWPAKAAWMTLLEDESYYATPAAHAGLLFAVNKMSGLIVVDLATGKEVHRRVLRPALRDQVIAFPSPVVAGKHLFVSSEDGLTLILETKPPFREVARNSLEPFRSTPAFDGRRMYVRGQSRLWAIEEPR